jgi:hypothetical protein
MILFEEKSYMLTCDGNDKYNLLFKKKDPFGNIYWESISWWDKKDVELIAFQGLHQELIKLRDQLNKSRGC